MISRLPSQRILRRPAAVLVAFFLCLGGTANLNAQAEKTEASREDAIVFCSYNLKNWLMMDRTFKKTGNLTGKPEKEKAKVIEFLKAIHPDVLGVCEIGSDDDVADLKKRLADVGLDYPFTERAHGGDPVRALALLSKFPITARNSQTSLSYQLGELTLPFQRGILDVTIEVNPQFKLRCLGVHLKSMRTIPEADQALMRRNEAYLVRKHVEGIMKAEPGTKLLAYGDFNDHPKNDPIVAIRGDRAVPENSLSDVPLRDVNGLVWTHSYEWEDSYSRLDYAFVNRALHPHVSFRRSYIFWDKDFDKASDHRPLVLQLSLKSTKAEPKKAEPVAK